MFAHNSVNLLNLVYRNLSKCLGGWEAIYERYLLQLENRNAFHRIKNAEQRLEVFEKTQPGLSNRVKGKLMASYLNVSPQQLSRIRSSRRKS
jgi:hypothetical protein